MAKKQLIYEATAGFFLGGQYVPAGATVVHGHPLLKGRTHLFKPFVPDYGDIEGAELPEPEPEPAPKKAKATPEKKQAAEDQAEVTDSEMREKANEDGSFQPSDEEDAGGAAS